MANCKNNDLSPSESCKTIIREFEGLATRAYKCPAGIYTCGYGSTSGITANTVCTKGEAEKWLSHDLYLCGTAVKRLATVPLTQGQFDALCSFVYNIGAGNFSASTMLKLLNAGNYSKAAEQFERWIYAGKKILPGLVRRRKAERALFES